MFSKIDKKVLVIAAVVLALVALAGIGIYRQFMQNQVDIQNFAGGASTQNPDQNSDDGQAQIELITTDQPNSGGLTICKDECGNGTCQIEDPDCPEEPSMNCICSETKENCPADCN